jgi:hypothetical protein
VEDEEEVNMYNDFSFNLDENQSLNKGTASNLQTYQQSGKGPHGEEDSYSSDLFLEENRSDGGHSSLNNTSF